MSREIKFRVWDNVLKELFPISGILLERFSPDTTSRYYCIGELAPNENSSVDEDFVLMQYTELKDKNGKEIFEGDIIEVSYGRGKVVFNAGCFMIEWIDDKESYMELLGMYHKTGEFGRPRKDILIIGNVFDNPELLK